MMTPQVFAAILNSLTPEQVAQAMERLPTDVLEAAVRFEALGRDESRTVRPRD